MIVEFSQFKLDEDVDEEEFIEAAQKAKTEFLEKQPGFMGRELLMGDDEWVDIVKWNTQEEAEAAMEKSNESEIVTDFVSMIDEESLEIAYLEPAK